MIYCSFPQAQYKAHKSEIDEAIMRVLNGGNYILGEEVASFENEFEEWLGVKYAIGVNSGTDALFLALRAFDVGPGDEVIAPSFTALPTISAIGMAGATPVLVDVEQECYTIDPVAVENAITTHTRAIIAVHLYGQAADMEKLAVLARKHNLALIEDCAQAHGAVFKQQKIGTFGDAACFSFYPTKNLGALGDGGAVVSNNVEVDQKIRQLRQYGWNAERVSLQQGCNSRLDEVQAAVLRVKLRYLEANIQRRIEIADTYDRSLKNLPVLIPHRREQSQHAFHLYVIQTDKREELYKHLEQRGILTGIHYPRACHQMPAYAGKNVRKYEVPVTVSLVGRVLSLPLYPELSDVDQQTVVNSICEYFD